MPHGRFVLRSAPFADLLDNYSPMAKHFSQDFLKFVQ